MKARCPTSYSQVGLYVQYDGTCADHTLELVCELFYRFDKSVDENTQLNWIHNHSTIQNNNVSNIEISRRDLHDITKRTTLIRKDVPMTVSGMYQCRYGSSSADPISMPKIVTVFQILIGKE